MISVKHLHTSVIIPHFNRSEIVLDSIQSCLDQTIKPYEIIIIDDYSNYEHFQNLKKNLNDHKNPEIKFVIKRLNRNYGPSFCRNFGLNIAQGEIIFF